MATSPTNQESIHLAVPPPVMRFVMPCVYSWTTMSLASELSRRGLEKVHICIRILPGDPLGISIRDVLCLYCAYTHSGGVAKKAAASRHDQPAETSIQQPGIRRTVIHAGRVLGVDIDRVVPHAALPKVIGLEVERSLGKAILVRDIVDCIGDIERVHARGMHVH